METKTAPSSPCPSSLQPFLHNHGDIDQSGSSSRPRLSRQLLGAVVRRALAPVIAATQEAVGGTPAVREVIEPKEEGLSGLIVPGVS